MGAKINVVLRRDNKLLSYPEIIAIILHEIAHCTFSDHGDQFKHLEQQLRYIYIQSAMSYGYFPPWNKIIFPESTGEALVINDNSQFEKFLCGIIVVLIALVTFSL